MALTETKIIDKIEIVGLGYLQVRETSVIMRDGQEIAKTYHRSVFPPGSDVSAMPANVQDIARAVWSPEVIATYQAEQQRIAAEMAAQAAQE